jgi:hypothetical protein
MTGFVRIGAGGRERSSLAAPRRAIGENRENICSFRTLPGLILSGSVPPAKAAASPRLKDGDHRHKLWQGERLTIIQPNNGRTASCWLLRRRASSVSSPSVSQLQMGAVFSAFCLYRVRKRWRARKRGVSRTPACLGRTIAEPDPERPATRASGSGVPTTPQAPRHTDPAINEACSVAGTADTGCGTAESVLAPSAPNGDASSPYCNMLHRISDTTQMRRAEHDDMGGALSSNGPRSFRPFCQGKLGAIDLSRMPIVRSPASRACRRPDLDRRSGGGSPNHVLRDARLSDFENDFFSSNSPWIRGAPHVGLSTHIHRINAAQFCVDSRPTTSRSRLSRQ